MKRKHPHLQDRAHSFSHTVGCSHRLSLLRYLTTGFSAIKRKILGGLGRWLITTMQALAGTQVYILSVMVDNGSFPFVLMNLGNSNSL